MADADARGILYFGALYRWLEDAFAGSLSAIGCPLGELLGAGHGCPCVTSATSYHLPLVFDDEISVRLRPASLGRSAFSLTTEVTPTPVPDWLRQAFTATTWTTAVATQVPAESGASR